MAPTPQTTKASTSQAASSGVHHEPVTGLQLEREQELFRRLPGEGFVLDAHLRRACRVASYVRRKDDPVYRPLWVYTLDPSVSRLDGGEAVLNVPFEPLDKGPTGLLFEVKEENYHAGPTDLETRSVLINRGFAPSRSEPAFRQQMAYAVATSVHAGFRKALGREVHWAFGEDQPAPVRLKIQPTDRTLHANAVYDRDRGEIRFGVYPAQEPANDAKTAAKVDAKTLPGGMTFTCLSHDIVAHETAHALIDGLRPNLLLGGNESRALHEALADLVAVFQHFSYPEVLIPALAQSRGRVAKAKLLTDLATQFGWTTGEGRALRTVIDVKGEAVFKPGLKPHELGGVLVSAVFEAFTKVYQRKVQRLVRLASGGSSILPEGDLSEPLCEALAERAARLAQQFLSLVIRALDYCPPVDITFGDFVRAMITADLDLIPDDPWGYRDALIEALRRRSIPVANVPNLATESLVWRSPQRQIRRWGQLDFASLRFCGDPGSPVPAAELARQARALGQLVTDPRYQALFGLTEPAHNADLPRIEAVSISRRVGPDGQVLFDLIGQVTQRRKRSDGVVMGGATVFLNAQGRVRYVIRKSVTSDNRSPTSKPDQQNAVQLRCKFKKQ